MIRSMTGYGRGQEVIDGLSVMVEMKSVNHRNYEFSCRTPRGFGFLDDKLKLHLQQRISRGKVDVYVQIHATETAVSEVVVDHALAESYLAALRELAQRHGLRDDVSVTALSRYPDVLDIQQTGLDEEMVWNAVRQVADKALDRFIEMRETEGARMRDDLLSRAAAIKKGVEFVEQRSPETVREHMEKVEARMRELLAGVPVDEARLLNEAAVYADKVAVAEETVRLRSHLEQLEDMVNGDIAIGRKLDFLVQEINREANTIGSKCNDLQLTRVVLDIKGEIEKIREQLQNIE